MERSSSFSKTNNQKTPLEILETREFSSIYGHIDQLMLSGDYQSAFHSCLSLYNKNIYSTYLLRRLVLLRLVGYFHEFEFKAEELLKKESNSKILLSNNIYVKIKEEKFSEALGSLSRLGEELILSGLPMDELEIFDVVFPELLGDLWLNEDKEISMSCYERILRRQGDIPRILRKMLNLVQEESDIRKEKSLLNKLLQVETRSREIAKIYQRQALIAKQSEQDVIATIDLSMKALSFDKKMHESAILLADSLCEVNRTDEAIELLTELIEDRIKPTPNHVLALYECKIGQIWKYSLYRNDLALRRFEKAKELDPDCEIANTEWQMLAEYDSPEYSNIAEIEEKFKQVHISFASKQDRDDLHQLICFYTKHKLHSRLDQVLKTVFEHVDLYQNDILSLVDCVKVSASWNVLIDRILEQLSDKSDVKTYLYGVLGTIYHLKMKDHDQALKYYLESVENGHDIEEAFDFIFDQLVKSKNFEKLMEVSIKRLESMDEGRAIGVLNDLLMIQENFNSIQQEDLLVRLYTLDQDKKNEIENYIYLLCQNENYSGLKTFMFRVLEVRNNDLYRYNWLTFWNETLKNINWDKRFDQLHQNYEILLGFSHDRVEILDEAIEFFHQQDQQEHLGFYIEKSLEYGLVPNLPTRYLLDLIKDQLDYLGMYFKCIKLDLKKYTDQITNILPWAKENRLPFEYIEILLSNISQLENLSLVSEILVWQFEHNKDNVPFEHRLIEQYISKLEDVERYQAILDFFELYNGSYQAPLARKLNWVKSGGDVQSQKKVFYESLVDGLKEGKYEELEELLTVYLQTVEQDQLVSELKNMLSIIEGVKGKLEFSRLLFKNNVIFPLAYLGCCESLINKKEFDLTISHWIEGVKLNKSEEDILKFNRFVLDLNLLDKFNFENIIEKILKCDLEKSHKDLVLFSVLDFVENRIQVNYSDEVLDQLYEFQSAKIHTLLFRYLKNREYQYSEAYIKSLEELIVYGSKVPDIIDKSPMTMEALKRDFTQVACRDVKYSLVDEESVTFYREQNYVLKRINKLVASDLIQELVLSDFQIVLKNFDAISNEVLSIDLAEGYNNQVSQGSLSQFSYAAAANEGFESSVVMEEPYPHIPELPKGRKLQDKYERKIEDLKDFLLNQEQYRVKISEILLNKKISDIQKHITVQIVALRFDDLQSLKQWKWKTWHASGRTKVKSDFAAEKLAIVRKKNPLLKLVLAMTPLLVKLYKQKFTSEGLAKSLNLSIPDFSEKAQSFDWNHEIMQWSGLDQFSSHFDSRKYRFYHLEGMDDRIFYDGVKRIFFLDVDAHKKYSANLFFYQFMQILYSIEMNLFPLMILDFETEVFPVLESLYECMIDDRAKLEESSEFNDKLKKSSPDIIEKFLKYLGKTELKYIVGVKQDVQQMVEKRIFLETLDLVGMFEFKSFDHHLKAIPKEKASLDKISHLIHYAIRLVTEGV